MAVAAACGDHMRIGDGDVVQVKADDGIGTAVQFVSERRQLNLALAQGAIGEHEFGHAPKLYSSRPLLALLLLEYSFGDARLVSRAVNSFH
jgi:hypothetical protein